jgi:pyruvate carboxylase subunit B
MNQKAKQEKKNPVKIMDTTLRDGHQSSLATRMRTEDMLPIAEQIGNAGFYAVEVWGGATFDVCTRFLNEDPWERVRILKKYIPKTPFQMLLRGQNLVGYRHYADDLAREFVYKSCEVGIDIFRVFDALNDERNFETCFEAIKKCKKHIQATICFSLTERRLGGPVFNIEYFVNKAKVMQDMGADTLCVKDMAGLISPYDVYELIKALKEKIDIPIQLHTHYTSGMASMAYLKAIEAGVDIVDCALAPFALRTSQPAVEPIVVALQGTERDTGLDLGYLFELGQYIESIAPKYRDFLNQTKMATIDTGVLLHQVPGGMTSNLVSQLKQADALDRIDEVYEDLPKTRKDLGYPPLVTPTSQIVGIQAVQNVLFGRYKMVTEQVKDLAYGLYGKTPVPMDKEVQKLILKGYERGEEPITCRAADILEPELEKAREKTKGIAKDIGDVLIYALYPTTGMRFLRWKYGLEEPPAEVRPKTMEEVKREDELIEKAKAGKLIEKQEKAIPEKGADIRTFNVFVEDEYYQVQLEEAGGSPVVTAHSPLPRQVTSQPAASKEPEKRDHAKEAPVDIGEGETAITAPIPGMIIRYNVDVGDNVKSGDVVVIFEAMKMENSLASSVDGTVKAINFKNGDSVKKGQVLAVIG